MLVLTSRARGSSLGERLTDECIIFAHSKSFKKMLSYTNSCPGTARRIYAQWGLGW